MKKIIKDLFSGDFIFFSKNPFQAHSPIFRFFGTKSVPNRHKTKLRLRNIKGLDDALSLYEDMSATRPLPTVIQFNQFLSRVVKFKEYPFAIRIFKGIYNLAIPVDEYTMNIAINCYCLSGRVDYGFSILGWFFKRGCVPDVFTYTTLLKSLFRENKSNEAQELFRKMVREGLCELDVVTYGTVIDGLRKAGNTAMAIQLLRVMEKGICKPNTPIYNMLIDGLCADGMIDSALSLFEEMDNEKGTTPDVFTYTALVCGLCSLSRWREVKMLVKKMIDYEIYPNVVMFNTLVDALCKEGLVDEAEDVIHIMKQQNVIPDVFTYNSLLGGYCLQGRMDKARIVFDSMAASIKIAENIMSFNILIHGYCKKKKVDSAIHLFHEMPSKGLKPNIVTYSILLDGLFCVGLCSSALNLFDELQAVGLKADFYTYCIMLDGLCKNGQVEKAVSLLDALERKGEENLQIRYYNIVMDGFVESQKLDVARDLFKNLPSKGCEPNVVSYNILIKGCCQNGLLEEAKDLLLKMGKAGLSPDRITCNTIVQGRLKKGEYDYASKHLDQMYANRVSPDASTLELMLDLLGTEEQNPNILKMIQMFGPNS